MSLLPQALNTDNNWGSATSYNINKNNHNDNTIDGTADHENNTTADIMTQGTGGDLIAGIELQLTQPDQDEVPTALKAPDDSEPAEKQTDNSKNTDQKITPKDSRMLVSQLLRTSSNDILPRVVPSLCEPINQLPSFDNRLLQNNPLEAALPQSTRLLNHSSHDPIPQLLQDREKSGLKPEIKESQVQPVEHQAVLPGSSSPAPITQLQGFSSQPLTTQQFSSQPLQLTSPSTQPVPQRDQSQPMQQSQQLQQLHDKVPQQVHIHKRILNTRESNLRSKSMSGPSVLNVIAINNPKNTTQVSEFSYEQTSQRATSSQPNPHCHNPIQSLDMLLEQEKIHRQTLSMLAEEWQQLTLMKAELLHKMKLIDPDISTSNEAHTAKRRCLIVPSDSQTMPSNELMIPGLLIDDNNRGSSEEQPEPREKTELSAEQQVVMNLVIQSRKNVFFTGAAGTGKSVLLRQIIYSLRKQFPTTDAVAVTASTGLAACNIGGVTLHSFAGVGLAKENVGILIKRVMGNRRVARQWRAAKVLVIDEISMVDARFLDKLDQIGRHVRYQPHKPFGGIQLVFTGDFYQLPPVSNIGETSLFAFEAQCWCEAIEESLELKTVFRQKDAIFANMLNEMRCANLSEETIAKFTSLDRKINHPPDITPTELFSARVEVDRRNGELLGRLKTRPHVYTSVDYYKPDVTSTSNFLRQIIVPEKIEIRVGAQVMMIKDVDASLVSGTVGTVIGFQPPPPRNSSPPGLVDFRGTSYKVSDEVRSTILGTEKGWPNVKFFLPNGEIREQIVVPEIWYVRNNKGCVLASRTQVPLILAWSMTIHKAQGQTLAWLKVDLKKTFETGQAYVAISRAIRLEGLQVLNFSLDRIRVHPKVVSFYQSLIPATDEIRMKLEPGEDNNSEP